MAEKNGKIKFEGSELFAAVWRGQRLKKNAPRLGQERRIRRGKVRRKVTDRKTCARNGNEKRKRHPRRLWRSGDKEVVLQEGLIINKNERGWGGERTTNNDFQKGRQPRNILR